MQRELGCISLSWERTVHILLSPWVTVLCFLLILFRFLDFLDSYRTIFNKLMTFWTGALWLTVRIIICSLYWCLIHMSPVTTLESLIPCLAYSQICFCVCVCRERRGGRETKETRKTASEKVTLQDKKRKKVFK